MTDKQADDPYLRRLRGMPKPVRIICARPRLFISLAVGLAALLVLPTYLRLATRLLVAWDTSIALYIVLAFVLFLATAHGVVSFIFNTALVALMVNIAASAI